MAKEELNPLVKIISVISKFICVICFFGLITGADNADIGFMISFLVATITTRKRDLDDNAKTRMLLLSLFIALITIVFISQYIRFF